MKRGESQTGGMALRGALAPVAALLVSVALLLMGNGLQGTLLPIRGVAESFSNLQIGVQGTFYFLGFTIGCFTGPYLLSRGGHIRTFMAMASLTSVTALLHAMMPEPYLWAALRGITGYCFAVLYIVIESWLNEKSTNANRGTVFSVYTIVNLTVVTIGQMMVGLASPETFLLFAVTSILISVSALPLAFTTSASPSPATPIRANLTRLYRISPVGFVGCAAVGFANGAFWALAPLFAQSHGLDPSGVGLFMSAIVLGGAVAQWPFGALSDRVDRRYVVIAAAALACVAGLALTFLAEDNLWALLGIGGLLGAGAMPVYALSVAHANDHARPDQMVEVSSGLLLVFGAGAAMGPVLASLLQSGLPFPALFTYTALIHGALVAFVLWRLLRRGPVAREDRVTFTRSAVAAQTLSETGTVAAESIGRDKEPDERP